MKKTASLLSILLISLCSFGQQTWASLTSTQCISWGAFQDAINTGVLTQKQTLPAGTYRLVERDSIAAYVYLDTTNAGFAARGMKQMITKADITKGSLTYSIQVGVKYSAATTGRYVWYSINDATMASPTRLTTAIGNTTATTAGTISATSGQTIYLAIGDITGVAAGVDPFNYRLNQSGDNVYPAFPTACSTASFSTNINFTPAYIYMSVLANGLACSVGTNEVGGVLN